MSRVIKFRCWNAFSSCMHDWGEMVEKNKIHLLNNENKSYVCEQFTGLTDKNGVEIYEGDILCAGNEKYKGVVFYQSSNAQFLVDVFLNEKTVCRNEVKEFMAKRERAVKSECVVIGNVHQNPELIGE